MATYNSNKWDAWMRATMQGDQESYRLLLTNLRPWLMAYFGKRTQRNVVEDLVQDTLLTLHNKRQTFDPSYPFGPWIAAIARHRWIDHLRSTLKYVETEEIDENFPAQECAGGEHAKHDVRTLLTFATPAQAQVIDMLKLQGMSVQEISKQTGHSPSSVKIMVHRGMKKMMAAVEEVVKDD